jgi:Uma2 family endonuclease
MPQDDPHAVSVSLLPDEFAKVIPQEWIVRTQLPITMAGNSEPEPDGVVCLGPKRRYGAGNGHPKARDIAIVIEVADTTLRRDRTTKLRIYARNRLPVYWIINLIEDQIEVYAEPRATRVPTYRSRANYVRGSKAPVVVRSKVVGEILVDELLA